MPFIQLLFTFLKSYNHKITWLESPQGSPTQTPNSSLLPLLYTFSHRKVSRRESCWNGCGSNSLALPKSYRWESSVYHCLSFSDTASTTGHIHGSLETDHTQLLNCVVGLSEGRLVNPLPLDGCCPARFSIKKNKKYKKIKNKKKS